MSGVRDIVQELFIALGQWQSRHQVPDPVYADLLQIIHDYSTRLIEYIEKDGD